MTLFLSLVPSFDTYLIIQCCLYETQIVMANLRGESNDTTVHEAYDAGIDEPMRGMNEPDYDMWEEWMGWEGAGIRDYSSHINPYI